MNELERNTIIDQLGLTYSAVFVPTRQPADKVQHPQLHWICTFTKGRQSMTIPYHQGCAHVPGYQQFHKNNYEKRLHDDMIREACETGIVRADWKLDSYKSRKVKQPEPTLTDVLYCLVMDSSVLNTSGFEEWASDCGYDTDSRKAEKTYRACLEQSLQLKSLIGQAALDTLQEAFQDY